MTPTTKQTPPTDPAAEWLAELCATLDLLEGGAVARLARLVESMPPGADAVFPALAATVQRFDPEGTQTDHVAAAHRCGESLAHRHSVANAYADIVGRLHRAAEVLLDRGLNDPADPIVLPKMFQNLGKDPHDRRVGLVRGMSPACPLPGAGVEPITLSGEPHYVLGAPQALLYRTSRVRRLTEAENVRLREARAESERLEQLERENQRRAYENSPEGQAVKMRALQAEVVRLKAAQPTAPGPS